MRRTLVAASVFVLVGMTGTATAFAADALQGDLDCKNFDTQEEAQAEFDKHETDIHDLDRDDDGMACDSLPSGPVDTTTTPPPDATEPPEASETPITTPAFEDKDCVDFATKGDAQATLDADRSDPHRLDADDDSLACETHFSDGQDDDQQVRVHPVGGVATGGNGGEGDDSGAFTALGAFVLVGAGVALVARRRAQGGR